jgi:hypothetical protein
LDAARGLARSHKAVLQRHRGITSRFVLSSAADVPGGSLGLADLLTAQQRIDARPAAQMTLPGLASSSSACTRPVSPADLPSQTPPTTPSARSSPGMTLHPVLMV